MLKLGQTGATGIQRILCIGAHSDDIEIGCGGTLLTLLAANPRIEIDWVVLSAFGSREAEARKSAERFLADGVSASIRIEHFRERYFPYIGSEVKEYFDSLSDRVSPDIIFSHGLEDRHQDHRIVAELVGNSFRDHLVLQYEIPKFDGDLSTPNVYVEIEGEVLDRKIRYLLEGFPTQSDRYWFTEDTFRGLARIRGVESKAVSGFAEGFHCRKLVLL
jgi:LmbE family N-acetylglucosaminyl deacetylase